MRNVFGTIVRVLAAGALVGIGALRSVRRRYATASRHSFGGAEYVGDYSTIIYNYCLLRQNGDLTISRYYSFSYIEVPRQLSPLAVCDKAFDLGKAYEDELDGYVLSVTYCVPIIYRSITMDKDGGIDYQVQRRYSFNAFCDDHGVSKGRLLSMMKDLRCRLYYHLVEEGFIGDDEIR